MRSIPILLAAVLLLTACSSIPGKRPDGSPAGDSLVGQLRKLNAGVRDIKGIARLRRTADGHRSSARIAFAGRADGALRIDLIGIDGRPMASLAADGNWVSYRGYRPYQFRRQPSSAANLERILSIPISAREAVLLLSGRIPVGQYQRADCIAGDGRKAARLELKGFWGDLRQTLTLEKNGHPAELAFFQFGGGLRYRAQRTDIRLLDGFALPFGLTLTAANGTTVSLAIQRLLPNTGLADDLFVLQEAP
jgi:hypothetical protein